MSNSFLEREAMAIADLFNSGFFVFTMVILVLAALYIVVSKSE